MQTPSGTKRTWGAPGTVRQPSAADFSLVWDECNFALSTKDKTTFEGATLPTLKFFRGGREVAS